MDKIRIVSFCDCRYNVYCTLENQKKQKDFREAHEGFTEKDCFVFKQFNEYDRF